MANRYWVGGTGNWSDTSHWSATSGGVSGASVPTSADSVYFDALSFTATGQTVTMNVAANCLDMSWIGATNNPIFSGNAGLNIYGSVTYILEMTLSSTGATNFRSVTTGKSITTNGNVINSPVSFLGIGGGWTLQDDLTTTSTISVLNGTFDTGGKNVSCTAFNGSGTNTRSVLLNNSTITLSNNLNFTTVTGLTFNAGTSTIVLTGNAVTFIGGGLAYNNVEFQGTTTTITGSNTFNTLTVSAGKTVKPTSGTTQTITSLVCNGTTANPSTLQSVTAASPATIALPSGRYFIRHTSIKDITVTGATSVTSIAGTNVSGNTGITFVTKFEMGRIKNDGSFNWYNTTTGTVTKVSG